MTTAPDISVVIPCYNAQGWLRRAVASALSQQGAGEIEVILVDDRSTDGTHALIRRLAAEDPRITALQNARNLGPGGSRNAAIAAARGRWVALLDADDAFAPGRLKRLLAVANESGSKVVADLLILYDLAADAVAPTQPPAPGGQRRLQVTDLLEPDPASGLDLGLLKPLFDRSLATSGLWHYSDARHGEDFNLYVDLLLAEVPFTLLQEAHYIFSARIGEISGRFSPGSVTDVDYGAIALASTRLAERLATRPDGADMARLLHARAERARATNRIYGWTTLRKREWGRLRRWLARDPRNRRELLAILRAKLRGHRGSVATLR
jgi:succinoglycan biosynthesis protein ExoO